MSELDWDADDFEPPATIIPQKKISDKWDGEDEDDVVKDNWDDDDEEEEETPKNKIEPKKKKKLADVIAEKEQKALSEKLRRQKLREEAEKDLTPEERIAEKLRMRKVQEDSDLAIASDMLGVNKNNSTAQSLDGVVISSKADLDNLREYVISQIKNSNSIEKRSFFVPFVESLNRGICEKLESDDIKKLISSMNTIYNDKVKANKQTKGKKKGANKAKLNVGQGVISDEVASTYNDFDDYDFI